MASITNKLNGGNLYVGANSWAGMVKEITLPELTSTMADYVTLSSPGTPRLPTGLDALECTIVLMSPTPEAIKIAADHITAQSFTVRGSLEQWQAGGKVTELPYVLFLRGTVSVGNLGAINAKDLNSPEMKIEVNAIRLEIGGQEQFNIDIYNSIWRVDGVDRLQAYRTNLGL